MNKITIAFLSYNHPLYLKKLLIGIDNNKINSFIF